jgi:hypothetical protein
MSQKPDKECTNTLTWQTGYPVDKCRPYWQALSSILFASDPPVVCLCIFQSDVSGYVALVPCQLLKKQTIRKS